MSFQLIKQQYFNQDYKGPAESCTYNFTVNLPDQVGAQWTAEQHVQATMDELASQNSIILEYRLWEDKSPTFTTDYKCEVVASASPLFWFIIIGAVLLIIGILVTGWAISQIKEIIEYGGSSAAAGIGILAIAVVVFLGVVGFRRAKSEAG